MEITLKQVSREYTVYGGTIKDEKIYYSYMVRVEGGDVSQAVIMEMVNGLPLAVTEKTFKEIVSRIEQRIRQNESL
ncbi:hypothetical protein [Paenibacillus polymyxa]|uniref:M1-352 n=1 Tax=Paenibacillus polymyxa (strain SC2) TaxID=886882 RepID=E3EC58_PAEPS|nr:hypothetical protein [Paenibacillus polymyxa]ADO54201.1 M1-352 [Paenibacillus polymyxa SC2]WPQ57124.1 hypothetical protein SKN87_01095 [Paenibacillus polymyxa]CCC83133.1 hypothetical protein PPM_0196 [Paenibacillus polymyxa M1]